MTAKAALAKALLKGEVVNIKNGFSHFGITNVPREIGRSIERAFGVEVSRTQMDGKSRYGQPCVWVDYFLRKSQHNMDGIAKMISYVKEQEGEPKTEKQAKELKNLGNSPKLKVQKENNSCKQESLF